MTDHMIPDERDQIERPKAQRPERPDLRCAQHEDLVEVVHALHQRVVELEERVSRLEGSGV